MVLERTALLWNTDQFGTLLIAYAALAQLVRASVL